MRVRRRRRVNADYIAELEATVLDGLADADNGMQTCDEPAPVVARLAVFGVVCTVVGILGAVVVTSISSADDNVWDRGVAGWIFGLMMCAPFVLTVAGVALYACYGAIVFIARGHFPGEGRS